MNIELAKPNFGALELSYLDDALSERGGPYHFVERFEADFAAWVGRHYALMTPNCTSALHLTLKSLGIGPGDEVIVPDLTWIASAAPIVYVGATPLFADIDESSWCLLVRSVERLVTPKTKAIIAVDLYGNTPNWNALEESAAFWGLPLIEDAAQALGAYYSPINGVGVKCGTLGVASVFSFNRTKTLSTGEGGMLVTDDRQLYEEAKIFRDHGRREGDTLYFNDRVGFKYTPSNIAGALGCAQLSRINELLAVKRNQYTQYRKQLDGLKLQFCNDGCWATTLARMPFSKETVIAEMASNRIPVRPFFYPLSTLPAFSEGSRLVKVADRISQAGITLPSAFNLSNEDITFISNHLRGVLTA